MSTVVLEGGPAWLFYLARLVEFGVIILLTVVWCNSMERALRACDRSSRKMELGQSWLIFIPLFGFIWQFIAVNRVSTSLAIEYHLRGWKSDEGRPGIETGLIACVVVLVVFLIRIVLVDLNPGIAVFTSLAVCLCMYLHRERLNAFTERLEAENKKTQASFSFDSGPNPFSQQPFFPQNFAQPFPQSQQQYPPQAPNPQYQNAPVPQQIPFQPPAGIPQYQSAPPPIFPHYQNAPVPPPGFFPPVPTPQQQYAHQQFVNQSAQQNRQEEKRKREEEERRAPGWDGVTTWEPPEGWKHPDLTDPRPYFS